MTNATGTKGDDMPYPKVSRPPVARPLCGTLKGYNLHRTNGEARCAACNAARNVDKKARRRRAALA